MRKSLKAFFAFRVIFLSRECQSDLFKCITFCKYLMHGNLRAKKGRLSLNKEERERAREISEDFELDDEVAVYNLNEKEEVVKFSFELLSSVLAQEEMRWKPVPMISLFKIGGEYLFLEKKPLRYQMPKWRVTYEEPGGISFPLSFYPHFPVYPEDKIKENYKKEVWLSFGFYEDISLDGFFLSLNPFPHVIVLLSSNIEKEVFEKLLSFSLESYRIEKVLFLSVDEAKSTVKGILSKTFPDHSQALWEELCRFVGWKCEG